MRHQAPHCIARKPHAWPLSDSQEYCPDPRRRSGKDALRPCHTDARRCAPMRRTLAGVFPAPFGDTRACCSLAPAHYCIVFSFLGRKLTLPPCLFCLALEQRCSWKRSLGRQSPRWQNSGQFVVSFSSPAHFQSVKPASAKPFRTVNVWVDSRATSLDLSNSVIVRLRVSSVRPRWSAMS